MKVLAEGSHSRVNDAFIIVARDASIYRALRGLVETLPEMNDDFFLKNVVVAAFLGVRNTGGYSVGITRSADKSVRIAQQSPPPDAMVTQAFTNPFKVVSLPAAGEKAVALDLDEPWKAMLRPYRITAGELSVTGGIAGISKKFPLEGEVRVMRYGNWATCVASLKGGAKEEAPHAVTDAATGTVGSDGRIDIPYIDGGSLVGRPCTGLRAVGSFVDNESKLSLQFSPAPCLATDAFYGAGKLEAAATGPAPPKRKPSIMDEK
jgi:hypothetical protein